MPRSLNVFVFALLLLFGQQQALVHPLEHLPAKPARDAAVTVPQVASLCVTCELLAGGLAALGPVAPVTLAAGPVQHHLFFSYHSRAGEVPAWFQSRAPPVLL